MRTVISASDAGPYIRDRITFKTPSRNFQGVRHENGTYEVWSYWTKIAEFVDGVWYINDTRYSPVTNKQQAIVRHGLGNEVWTNRAIHLQHIPFGVGWLSEYVTGKTAKKRESRIRKTYLLAA